MIAMFIKSFEKHNEKKVNRNCKKGKQNWNEIRITYSFKHL